METLPALRLSGADKAAALLLAMDKAVAARLLKRFDPDELRRVTRSASQLRRVPRDVLDSVVAEFSNSLSGGTDLVGSVDEAQQLIAGVLSADQVSDLMADVLGRSNKSVWERVSNLPDGVLARHLAGEHPQTAALILSRVSPTCAAATLGHMPAALRNETTRRMIGLRPVPEDMVRLLEDALQADLLANPIQDAKTNPHARMADIINRMERDQMEEVLGDLAKASPDTADALRNLLFTFEDIAKLTTKARLILFEKVPAERLILALNGLGEELRELVLSSLTARSRRMVEQELATGQAAPAREVNKARRAVAELALELAERGEIELGPAEA